MALKSTSKQMCVYIFIVNTYEVGHLYLTIRTEWIFFFFNADCKCNSYSPATCEFNKYDKRMEYISLYIYREIWLLCLYT